MSEHGDSKKGGEIQHVLLERFKRDREGTVDSCAREVLSYLNAGRDDKKIKEVLEYGRNPAGADALAMSYIAHPIFLKHGLTIMDTNPYIDDIARRIVALVDEQLENH